MVVKSTSNCFQKFQKEFFFLEFLPLFYFTKMKNIFKIKACSSGDRASDSDSESQGFDSLHAYELQVQLFRFCTNLIFKIKRRIIPFRSFEEFTINNGAALVSTFKFS